jgi:hypothetical protein
MPEKGARRWGCRFDEETSSISSRPGEHRLTRKTRIPSFPFITLNVLEFYKGEVKHTSSRLNKKTVFRSLHLKGSVGRTVSTTSGDIDGVVLPTKKRTRGMASIVLSFKTCAHSSPFATFDNSNTAKEGETIIISIKKHPSSRLAQGNTTQITERWHNYFRSPL